MSGPMRAKLIVVEGIDGSGKGTQTARLAETLRDQGAAIAELTFPRYAETRYGRLIGRFLAGEFGSLDSTAPELTALLFAGDRFESKSVLSEAAAASDFVLCDRYAASNVAHQAGRLQGERQTRLIEFLDWLEFELHGLPRPDLTLWLDVPPEVSQANILQRAAGGRAVDIAERDLSHLAASAAVYGQLADDSNWLRIACATQTSEPQMRSPDAIAEEITAAVLERFAV